MPGRGRFGEVSPLPGGALRVRKRTLPSTAPHGPSSQPTPPPRPGHQRFQLHGLPEPPSTHHVPDRGRGAAVRAHGEPTPSPALPCTPTPETRHRSPCPGPAGEPGSERPLLSGERHGLCCPSAPHRPPRELSAEGEGRGWREDPMVGGGGRRLEGRLGSRLRPALSPGRLGARAPCPPALPRHRSDHHPHPRASPVHRPQPAPEAQAPGPACLELRTHPRWPVGLSPLPGA